MHRLFLSPEQFAETTARISGQDHLHLARVLRMRPGDRLILLDNAGRAFEAVLETIEKKETLARLENPVVLASEPPIILTVGQALGKGDKFEQVVQRGVEVGASRFVPLLSERCVSEIPAAKVADRLERWRSIAKGAAEQSGRLLIPHVAPPSAFQSWIQEQTKPTLLLHPAEDAAPLYAILSQWKTPPPALTVLVGPEGGWSPAEVSLARAANSMPATLGARVLRTENAALVALSQILYHFSIESPCSASP
jgi:16S rRNA (uracil1498-N3)-methyltransferase